MPKLNEEYIKTGRLRYVYRDFPLSFHSEAAKASEAANCAGEQGKYWQMHDAIFGQQKAMKVADLKAHAKGLGLDTKSFDACLDSGKYAPEVRKDFSDGQKAGVRGTPSFFIGLAEAGSKEFKALRVIRGAQPYAAFKQAIDGLLSEAKK